MLIALICGRDMRMICNGLPCLGVSYGWPCHWPGGGSLWLVVGELMTWRSLLVALICGLSMSMMMEACDNGSGPCCWLVVYVLVTWR